MAHRGRERAKGPGVERELRHRNHRGDSDTFNWLANQANYYAGELSRNVKSMTDAIAEELLGPAEDEEGDEIEEEDDSVRGDGHVVAGGATLNE